MKRVKCDELLIGSVLAEPVYIGDTLLLKEGTPISATLKRALQNFDVDEVSISAVFNEDLDVKQLNFDRLNELTYIAMKHLDIDKIITCARTLTDNLIKSVDSAQLNVLWEYDLGTYQHSLNVAELSLVFGIGMKYSIADLKTLALGALLHDVGKQCVPIEIINKPSKLTDMEYMVIKEHPQLGYDLVKEESNISSAVKEIIYQHHENFDGSGYPRQLFGIDSYKLARVIHICDVYEALCAARPYKAPLPRRKAREIMIANSGTMFDPKLLKNFLDVVPMYLVGEEIYSDNRKGIILDNTNKNDPIVFYHGNNYKLSDFERIPDDIDLESMRINT